MSVLKRLGDLPLALTIDDIAIVPRTGVLPSRSKAKLYPFIYSAPMDTVTGYDLAKALLARGHIPVVSRFISKEERRKCLELVPGEDIFFAIGLDDPFISDIYDWLETEGCVLDVALDIAHGDSDRAYEYIKTLRSFSYVGNIMSGSICTPEAATRNIHAGCTHLRIGVGPGSACSTRLMTGFGVPQAYAVASIHEALRVRIDRRLITLIADGGISQPGQAMKYMALGADAVMLGSVLSKTRESAGWIEQRTGFVTPGPDGGEIIRYTKQYRGQASAQFQEDILGHSSACPEGVALPVMTWDGKTTVRSVVDLFQGGVRSGLSYGGLTDLRDLHDAGLDFVRVTAAGQREAIPHGLIKE